MADSRSISSFQVSLSPSSAARTIMLKVVLLGDGGVGKTSVMNRYVSGTFDWQSFHTIGVEFLNKEIVCEDQCFTLSIWDTAGQERFKSLRTPFYRGSDICILTYAVDDRQSFDNLQLWKREFLYYADIRDANIFPFIVIGNKSDVETRTVSRQEAEAWCKVCDHPYVETSAKSNHNVSELFQRAVQRYIHNESRELIRFKDDLTTISLQSSRKSAGNESGNQSKCQCL